MTHADMRAARWREPQRTRDAHLQRLYTQRTARYQRQAWYRFVTKPHVRRMACRFPVNVIFVGMIGTSFWALQALNVAMVTVSF